MTKPQSPLHSRLRHATDAVHARVELGFDVAHMTRDLTTYRQVLMGLEASLSGAFQALLAINWPDWRPHLGRIAARRAWLEHDLRDLGTAPLAIRPRIDLASAGQGLGCLYVLEGSALGGLVIYKAAHRDLGLTPTHGARYFNGLGQNTLSEWQTFLADLNAHPAESTVGDEAEIGALRTFELFEEALRLSSISG